MDNLELDLKYRPRKLQHIIGNDTVKEMISNMLKTNKFPKFSIFTGPTGSGKTTAAFITAMTLLCESPKNGNRCGECKHCEILEDKLYNTGTVNIGVDLYMFDMGLNSDQEYVNSIARNVAVKGFGKKKVVIIEELQRVRKEHQDALLRTFEFIPEGTNVIVTTSEPYKIADAVKSRATEFRMNYPSKDELEDFLNALAVEEGIKITKEMISTLIEYHGSNTRAILKTLGNIKNSGDVDLSFIFDEKSKNRELCVRYFEVIEGGIADLVMFMDDLEEKAKFVHSIKFFLKDCIKAKYTRLIGLKKEEKDNMVKIISKIGDSEVFQLMDYLTKLPFISEEDAETILMVISYKYSNAVYHEVSSKPLVTHNIKGEDFTPNITNISETFDLTNEVIDLDFI